MNGRMDRIGKYQVMAPLHVTDYSDIFVCRDLDLDVRVCVKVFNPKKDTKDIKGSRPEDLRERFLREAKVMARMDHPHLMPIREYAMLDDGRPYIVMPFFPATLKFEIGYDADETKRQRRRPPNRRPHAIIPNRAIQVLDQVLDALAALHEFGLVHRDVKPGNLFLTAKKNGNIKLGDFGMTKVPGLADVETGYALGTRDYIAPEQERDAASVEPSADLFATGVLAFRMLAGRLPKGAEPFPQSAVKECPKGLGALVDRLRSKDPKTRPANASSARKQLEALY